MNRLAFLSVKQKEFLATNMVGIVISFEKLGCEMCVLIFIITLAKVQVHMSVVGV